MHSPKLSYHPVFVGCSVCTLSCVCMHRMCGIASSAEIPVMLVQLIFNLLLYPFNYYKAMREWVHFYM